MAGRTASKPYDVPLPTALGPGGLVSMLLWRREIPRKTQLSLKTLLSLVEELEKMTTP